MKAIVRMLDGRYALIALPRPFAVDCSDLYYGVKTQRWVHEVRDRYKPSQFFEITGSQALEMITSMTFFDPKNLENVIPEDF